MDLNGDGHTDLLSGSYSRMEESMAGLFQVLWGKADKTFKKAAVLNGTDGEPLIIPIADKNQQTENICTRPTAVDWDGDGDLDLIVGNFAGSFYVFTGEGKGRFQPKPHQLLVDGQPLKIEGIHSDPVVIDWDGDGDMDLLSGSSSGGVQWAENVGAKGKTPELKPFTTLIEPGPAIPYGQPLHESDLTGPTRSTRVWVDDVNGDGKLDILVGDSLTLISIPEGLTSKESKAKMATWQNELKAVMEEINNPDTKNRSDAIKRYQELITQRKKFISEERTGFVWLYIQK